MNRHTLLRALVAAACVGAVIGVPLGLALAWVDRLFPAIALPSCRSGCVPVSDPGVGRYWICPDRR